MEKRDPSELRLHPLHKQHLPQPVKDSDAWHSFVDALSAAGPDKIPAIVITKEGFIMEGGRRWAAARQLQWPEVRVEIQPETEAAVLMLDSLFGQRDMTRGAKVYIAIGLLEDYVKSGESRRLSNLQRRVKTIEKPLIFSKSSNWTSDGQTIEVLCARWGVHRNVYFQARHIRQLLHNPKGAELEKLYEVAVEKGNCPKMPARTELLAVQKDLRAEFEPQLFNGDKNLWNVASAIGGRIGLEGNPKPVKQLEFGQGFFTPLLLGAAQWAGLPSQKRNEFRTSWRKTIEQMPDDFREELAKVLLEFAPAEA